MRAPLDIRTEARRLTQHTRASVGALVLVVSIALAFAVQAQADVSPVLVTQRHSPPTGFRLTAAKAERIAARDPRMRAELRRHPSATPYEYIRGPGSWQVSWFSRGRKGRELAQVYVDDRSGRVTEAWTGFQVAWTMARGYPGAFGKVSNALYVWLPLCALFLMPFVPWRRLFSRESWSLRHLDLLALLGFSVSLAFFNHAKIGLSVPLVYPFLLYLCARLVALAFGKGLPRRRPSVSVPVPWLLGLTAFLIAFRITLNLVDSNVIDVGYAGAVGAHRLLHGQSLYGGWPQDIAQGDTYGPLTYYAYVPFTAIFGQGTKGGSLPVAHATAIAFDLLTTLGLYVLGRRLRGPALGALLAYCWVSYPFTLFAMNSNTNDTLVAVMVVVVLLAVTSAPARGFAAALAGMTKFAPLGLVPLFARGVNSRAGPDTGTVRGRGVPEGRRLDWPRLKPWLIFAAAFAAAIDLAMAPVALGGELGRFWHDAIVYQANRPSPFSVWGLWGGLTIEQHVVQGLVIVLAIAAAFVPKRRTEVEMAALGAAILIMIQLAVTYWFYTYIVWFVPLALLALLAARPRTEQASGDEAAEGRAKPVRSPLRPRERAVVGLAQAVES